MSARIDKAFAKAKAEKRAALIPFVMGYDPDAKTSAEILEALAANGADIIEIGMPFSDPMADGPVIQAAGLRALGAGATLKNILTLVSDFRKKNSDTPIILMGYFNPVYRYGNEQFCKDAAAASVDGLIIVDLPPEEEAELTPHLEKNNVHLIRLIAPTSNDERQALLTKSASGFVYYISVAGITGAKIAESTELAEQVSNIKNHTTLPIAVGFGIKTAEQVSKVAAVADAVVVGSALVDAIHKSDDAVKTAGDFVSTLANGLAKPN